MVADLVKAIDNYRAAQKAHEDAKAEVPAAWARVVERRNELAEAIAEAYRDGLRQVDIIRVTGMSRERVRQILRAAGIEADD
ncbi:hypothetical protein ACNTMW_04905 [Planosporangium sp. 12N6]|uniref:hypothetical protein n=1 Tax=Planosporangium spinosum TaxID=3402278 RepID=UPI003CEA1CE8